MIPFPSKSMQLNLIQSICQIKKRKHSKCYLSSTLRHSLPVFKARLWRLIFFRKYEIHKILIPHFPFNFASKLPSNLSRKPIHYPWSSFKGSRSFRQNLGEYSVDNPVSKSMVAIFHKVFFVNQEIMVSIELPELAVYDIEMLVWEVPSFTVHRKALMRKKCQTCNLQIKAIRSLSRYLQQ